MSILQEYDEIRRIIGEETYNDIMEYLDCHEDVLLSDIYYNEESYEKFKEWNNEKGK